MLIPEPFSVIVHDNFIAWFVQFWFEEFVISLITGPVLSILLICLVIVNTFPDTSVAVAYIYPFCDAVTLVAGAVDELAAVFALSNVVPNPAFLVLLTVASGYFTVAITFWFVHAVVLGVIVIAIVPTKNSELTFPFVALFPALSYTLVHK